MAAGDKPKASLLMSPQLPTIFKVPTPYPSLPEVSLLSRTWTNHIIKYHPDMLGKEHLVRAAVMNPTYVVAGTTNPDYLIFMNHDEKTSSGYPLTAVVAPQEKIIVTSYYNRTFAVVRPGEFKWRR